MSSTPKQQAAPVAPVRPAASVVILRDCPQGIETFMVERHADAGMAFAGALVFPGGKVDEADGARAWDDLAPPTPAHPGRAFWIAAVRETFEEAGLLLARTPRAKQLIDAEAAHAIVEAARFGPPGGSFAELVQREKLVLATDMMIHYAHWITPPPVPKRFDTHFFLVAAPVEQLGAFDTAESVEGLWLRPAEALAQTDAGRRSLVPVTRFTLELLASYANVAEAVAAARTRRIVTVMPRSEKTPAGRVIRIPPEAGYLTSELVMKG
jgi:8-oxo-dGTP pyrophosphatase MutT (NUDIX family)